MARLRTCASFVGVALLVSACLPHGLAFVQDKRLDIVAPESHSDVHLPVTVRWTIDDFRVTGYTGNPSDDAGYFGVFIDRAPVPPGKPLSWVSHGDKQCENTPSCPDRQYLADHRTYSTTKTSFTFPQVPDLDAYHGHETHEVTVVLLNGVGLRIGESAWYVDFFYDRPSGI